MENETKEEAVHTIQEYSPAGSACSLVLNSSIGLITVALSVLASPPAISGVALRYG